MSRPSSGGVGRGARQPQYGGRLGIIRLTTGGGPQLPLSSLSLPPDPLLSPIPVSSVAHRFTVYLERSIMGLLHGPRTLQVRCMHRTINPQTPRNAIHCQALPRVLGGGVQGFSGF